MNSQNSNAFTQNFRPWSRSKNGIFAGVCLAISHRFQVEAMLVRLGLLFSVLFFGFGIGLYIIFAIGLPREDRLTQAYENRLFGVCSRFAMRFDLDVGLTRVAALTLLICSFGAAIFGYFILYFTLPNASELTAQKNRERKNYEVQQ